MNVPQSSFVQTFPVEKSVKILDVENIRKKLFLFV